MKKIMFSVFAVLAAISMLTSCDPDPIDPVIGDIHITEDIMVNTVWQSQYVYYVDQSINVTNSAILTIEPGTTIKFAPGKSLTVNYYSGSTSNIIAEGTVEKPILFTSQAQVKSPGDWDGIWLYEGASASKFRYCTFEYAGGANDDEGAITLKSETKASIDYCTFQKNEDYGVYVYNSPEAFNSFTNNTFTDNDLCDLGLRAYNVSLIGAGNVFSDYIEVKGSDIDADGDVIWAKQNVPYVIIERDIQIGSTTGTNLIVQAGATLKFSGFGMTIAYYGTEYGMLKANGTATDPVTFTSAATNPSKGDWNGITFYDGTSAGCIFDYCNLSYGGGYVGSPANVIFKYEQGSNVTLQNCNISDSQGYGIMKDQTDSSDPTLVNNTFSNNTSGDKNW